MEKEQPQQIQISVDPNIYAITNVSIMSNEEDFLFAINSGAQVKQYLANPKHAKRIYLLLRQQIEAYETKFGEIKTELPQRPQATQEENRMGF